MDFGRRAKLVLGPVIAVLAAVGLSGAASYAFPASTQAEPSTDTSMVANCGFMTACTAHNPSGFVLTLTLNTTSLGPNGSLAFSVSMTNPTSHYINVSGADNWYISDFQLVWACPQPYIPYAFAVFRGHLTILNLSSAANLIRHNPYVQCISTPPYNATSFSIPPQSTLVRSDLSRFFSSELRAISSGTPQGSNFAHYYSLSSDKPSVYTIVAGDEWGDFVLLNFRVVPVN